jgi:hypothetical protein
MDEGLSYAGLLDVVGIGENGPGEREEAEVLGVEQARKHQERDKRR